MAINLKFDLIGNPEPPSIVLANRNGNKLGQLNVNVDSIDVSDKFNAASEFSFTLNKYIDGKLTPLWDKVKDFKLVYCPEWNLWFEIKVELDETTETVKTVFCTQLGQAELSQIKVYNIHINEEGDPNWDTNNETYKSTILYDKEHTDTSLLHRLLKDKAPHYSIAYVDESIQRIQKTFSFDDISICDAFNEIAEEIGCLFVYNSNSTKGGKPNRTISVYDLQQNCKDCGHRGEFTNKCPKCGSTNIKYGYGEDTTIFVTSDELATEGIQLITDVDSVKNCFKLEGGDDLMTATIRNCNPNGSDYIWYFSNALKEDMSKELVEKLESYDDKYQNYYNNHISELNEDMVNQYNNLVNKYKVYYNTKSTCLNCGHEEYFQEQCPKCNSKNILNGQELQNMSTTIIGYSDLMTAYYNTIDLLLYLKSGLMPNVDIEANKTSAEEQLALLTTSSLSPVAVNVKEAKDISESTSKSAVLSMAKILVKSTYKVEAETLAFNNVVDTNGVIVAKTWEGKFIVTNYSDNTDTATSDIISVTVNTDAKTFIEQKIEKALNKENTDDYSITGLFAKEYNEFCEEIKKYALNPLDSFSNACDTCLSILQEQGVGNDDNDENMDVTKEVLYDELYKPYFDKQQAINIEIKTRQDEITIIEGVWDKSNENNPQCTTKGLQQYIEECQQDIQKALDFEKYLGEDLWLEFCAYRREDKYSNSNYVSDGLNNAELFDRALEFIRVAEEEIFKSAELQHSISATLNNLLSLPKFKPLLKSFKTGNWIRVQVDDKVYKLRLLEYGFGYGDSESISVEFSDVTKIKNGVTDVKEVLEQASSMASSYDSVQRQAQKGNVARSTIDQWIVDGLDSADVQIKNNDSEEILLTKSGLLARSYDDITGTYLPEQFKLTHNIMAYTDDNWKTVSAALGKHNYKYYKDGNFVDAEGYGMSAKFAQAAYIIGSQMIGGEIVSSNYQPQQKGTHINLINGDFDFAGGKIVYDSSDNEVKLKGVTIQWTGDDGVNAPEVKVENITGLDKYLEQLDDLEDQLDGLDGRTQTYSQSEDPSESWTDEEKANHIGDLWLNPDNGLTKRWTGTEWVEVTDSDLKELAQSKAQIFTAIPTPPYYVGDLWVQGDKGDIFHCVMQREEDESYNADDWVKSSKYTDDTRAEAAYSLADSAKGIADNAKSIGDKLVNGLGFQETEITGEYIISPVIAGGSLLIGDTTGTYAQITTQGQLTAMGADISGHINATSLTLGEDKKSLSNVAISGDYNDLSNQPKIPTSVGDLGLDTSAIIYKGDISQETKTDDNGINYLETTVPTTDGNITYSTYNIGDYIVFGGSKGSDSDGSNYYKVSKDGLLTARNAVIYGTIYATDGEFTGDIKTGSTLYVGEHVDENGNTCYNTWITEDGTLNTYNAKIQGTLTSPTIIGGTINGSTLNVGKILDEEGNHTGDYYTTITNDGYLKSVEGEFESCMVTDGAFKNCTITGGSLMMGSYNDGYSAWISSEDGVLHAYGACLEDIKTTSGTIGGWQITTDALYKNISGVSSGMCSTQMELVPSQGLLYTLNSDEASYAVGSMGYCEDVNVVIPNTYNGMPVTSIDVEAFKGCENLISVIISDSVTSIGNYAFSSCPNLKSIVIPNSVTSIGYTVFYQCRNLTNVTIPNSVTSMGHSVFNGCSSLTNITIPNGITSIGARTFYECSRLTNVVITRNTIEIGASAFQHCTSLTSVYYMGDANLWNEITISSGNSYLENATRYYYSSDELTNNNCVSLVNKNNVSSPRFFAGSVSNIPTFINDAKFLVLEDGSLYASAAKISGDIEATSGNISNLKIANGGLEGYLTKNNVNINSFNLNSGGLTIYDNAASIQVGTICLRPDKDYSVFSAQGAVRIQSEDGNGTVSYIKFGGTNTANSNTSNTATITLYAEGTGSVWSPAMKFYIKSDVALPVKRIITFYYNGADYGASYTTRAANTAQVSLTINAGDTQSDNYIITRGYNLLNRWIRFSTELEQVLTSTKAGSFGTSDTAAEICMNANHKNKSASIIGEIFTWSDSSNDFLVNGNIRLDENVTGNLGSLDHPWTAIFAESISSDTSTTSLAYTDSGTVDSSDQNIKQDIEVLPESYSKLFDSLEPVRYKYIENTSNRYHTGFIAQNVLESVKNAGLTSKDFAAYCEWESDNGDKTCGLRYSEFIALCVDQIQKLKARVTELEKQK